MAYGQNQCNVPDYLGQEGRVVKVGVPGSITTIEVQQKRFNNCYGERMKKLEEERESLVSQRKKKKKTFTLSE